MWRLERAHGGIWEWSGEGEGTWEKSWFQIASYRPEFHPLGISNPSEVSSKWWLIWVPYFGCNGHETHLMLELGKREFNDINERPWSDVVKAHLCVFSLSLFFPVFCHVGNIFPYAPPLWLQDVASLFLGLNLTEKSNCICPNIPPQNYDIYLDWWFDSGRSWAHSLTNHCHWWILHFGQV